MVIFSGAAIRGFFRLFHIKVAPGWPPLRGGSRSVLSGVQDSAGRVCKGRHHETFIREIITTGLDWYAVAFVVDSEKSESTTIIDRHTTVTTS